MSNALYDPGREGFLDGSINWSTGDIRVMLVKSSYTFSAAHKFLADLGAVDNGRSAALASKTVTNGVADAGLATAEGLGSASLAAEVDPAGIASSEALGAVTVGTPIANVDCTGAGIASGEAFGAPALATSVPFDPLQTGYPISRTRIVARVRNAPVRGAGGIESEEAFGLPRIGGGLTLVGIEGGAAQIGRTTVRRGVIHADEEFLLLAA